MLCNCFIVDQMTPYVGFYIMSCTFSLLFTGTLTVEQIYQDRDQFAKLVREVAAPDVGRMGIEILSFTIKVCFHIYETYMYYLYICTVHIFVLKM